MAKSLTQVEQDALALSKLSRAKLINRLTESLVGPRDPEIEKAWMEEADRRVAEIKSGKVKTIPGDVVMAKLKKRVARAH